MKQIIVAGCGPAGMMAAISAAREGAKVTILEGMEKPGKKLLITGNGRCNLTNLDQNLPGKYKSVDSVSLTGSNDDRKPEKAVTESDCVQKVLHQFSVTDTLNFFHELGLLTTDRNGYVYPYTGQANSVLELLLAELKRWKIKLKFSEKIIKIEKADEGWKVSTNSWTYSCDRIILCCGSRAASHTGSDGSGYELAVQAGHRVSNIYPSLTALIGKGKMFTACAGVRCHAKVSLFASEHKTWQKMAEDMGELQWTDTGISGIVVFQVSRYASMALDEGRNVKVILDFLPLVSKQELPGLLKRSADRHPDTSVIEALAGFLPRKLLNVCLEQYKIKPTSPAGNLKEVQMEGLADIMKNFAVNITGTRSFDQCQVCAGGIPLSEICSETLESKISSGLYFAGELLDVDGPCGGYNLQWAWSSGYVAGKHAGKE